MRSSQLSQQEEAAALTAEAIAAGAPVDMNDFLDSQCLEIRRVPEQKKEAV
jgi:hypothetical protein